MSFINFTKLDNGILFDLSAREGAGTTSAKFVFRPSVFYARKNPKFNAYELFLHEMKNGKQVIRYQWLVDSTLIPSEAESIRGDRFLNPYKNGSKTEGVTEQVVITNYEDNPKKWFYGFGHAKFIDTPENLYLVNGYRNNDLLLSCNVLNQTVVIRQAS